MTKIPIIPIENRFSWIVPAKLYYLGLMAVWAVYGAYQKYHLGWPQGWLFFANNEKCYFYDYLSEVHKNGLKTLELRYKKNGRLKNIKKEYQKIVKILEIKSDKITPELLKRLPTNRLVTLYNNYLKLFKEFWLRAIFAELSGYGSEAYLNKNITTRLFKDKNEAVNILIKPSDYSFFQKEQIELLKILKEVKISPRFKKYQDWFRYLNNHHNLKNRIDEHSEKYNWINNSYKSCRPLPQLYFYKKAREELKDNNPSMTLAKIKNNFIKGETERQKILHCIPSGNLKNYAAKAGECVAWHDDKKGRQLKFQRAFHYFIREFSRRFKIHFEDLLNCLPAEIDKVIKTGSLPLKELKKRKKLFLLQAGTKQTSIITGKEVARAFKSYTRVEAEQVKQIQGLAVSTKDKVIGRVRIINNSKDINKMKLNEVLVAEMTSPEYIVALRKALAVITDEGGFTCHAAIVSRELGIPCIVGTKIATKVFKDGQLVEVDANKGIVRVIK
ncbi:MAG: PEP-utilizing enzyme [Patescibacteria group bacterium]